MTEDEIKALVKSELDAALRSQELEVATAHYVSQRSSKTYVRHPIKYPHGYYPTSPSFYETTQTVSVPDLLSKILDALEALGIEVYHKPAVSAEWGLRKKESPGTQSGEPK